MFFKIWWNEVGSKWVPKIYLGTVVAIGLMTGIISFTIIPLMILVGLYFGIVMLLWFILLEKINQ